MLKKKFSLFLALLIGVCALPIAAPALNPETDCSDEILHSFFPSVFVNEVLKKYNIPQDKWDAIDKDLAVADKNVLKALEDKSKQLNADPRQDAQVRKDFIDFFRTTLIQNFGDVIKKYGVTDAKQTESMLEEIQELKLKRFEACYGQEEQDAPQAH